MPRKAAASAVGRQVKALKDRLKKVNANLAKKETPKRLESKKQILAKLKELEGTETKKTAVRKALPAKQTKVKRKRTSAEKKELRQLVREQIKDMKTKGGTTAGGRRAMSLTDEGEKLLRSPNPKDQEKLLAHIEKHGDRSKYVYESVGSRQAALQAKGTTATPEELANMSTSERIEYRRRRTAPLLTRQQAGEALYGKQVDIDPEDIATGFQQFTKGGLSRKRYQSTKKHGAKEHVYMGGGMVQDIVHFRKKRGR